MRASGMYLLISASAFLALFCSCATSEAAASVLPTETSMNPGAGRGDPLFLKLKLEETGQDLIFGVDTGSSYTVLDKSLESKLGQQVGTKTIRWLGGKFVAGVYRAPALRLGGVRLLTGSWIVSTDTTKFGFPGLLMGILGMDCLQHYCIQLDFTASACRFLDSASLHAEDLGQRFPLVRHRGCFFARDNLVGMKGSISLIDTGCNFDGLLTPKLFQQWTNYCKGSGSFGGFTYTKMDLHQGGNVNTLGLSFLAHHLVSLDFPGRMMYLKRVEIGD